MSDPDFLAPIVKQVASHSACHGLFLGGSHATGEADAFSDLDVVAVVEPGEDEAIVTAWLAALEARARLVYWRTRGNGPILANAITESWLRLDLYTTSRTAFATRAKDNVAVLYDPEHLHDKLASLPPPKPEPKEVEAAVWEFFRVLGLLKVAAGREDYVLSTVGIGHLREQLTRLLKAEDNKPASGGALHLKRDLSPEAYEIIRAAPCPRPERRQILQAHVDMAKLFVPRARAACARFGIPWPTEFENATRQSLTNDFGSEVDFDW